MTDKPNQDLPGFKPEHKPGEGLPGHGHEPQPPKLDLKPEVDHDKELREKAEKLEKEHQEKLATLAREREAKAAKDKEEHDKKIKVEVEAREKEAVKLREAKRTQKEQVHSQIQIILAQFNGLENQIPYPHEYWGLLGVYRSL